MKVKRTWLDNVISFLSPSAGLRRVNAKRQINVLDGRKFEGASKKGPFRKWKTNGSSANTVSMGGIVDLRNRARDLERNNPLIKRAISTFQGNVVGDGIIGEIKDLPKTKLEKANSVWSEWADKIEVDAAGKLNLYGIQSLVAKTVFRDGEVLIRRRIRRESDGLFFPLQLQTLEADFLDHNKTENLKNGNFIIQGVEFNSIGKIVAYWLFDEHPGGNVTGRSNLVPKRVEASEIIHCFNVNRPGQVRGVSEIAPVIVTVKDLDDFLYATLEKQKIVASFAGFITDVNAEPEDSTNNLIDIEPGSIEELPPGKDIKFSNPPASENFREFVVQYIKQVAVGLNLSYEVLSGDLSDVNFSSARMGWLEFQRHIDVWRWNTIIPQVLDPIFGWFKEVYVYTGGDISKAAMDWTPPRREMIDPTKEVPAMKEAVRSGFTSLKAVHKSYGYESDKIFDEIKESNEKVDELGLVLDSDPRNTNKTGAKQQQGEEKNNANASESEDQV